MRQLPGSLRRVCSASRYSNPRWLDRGCVRHLGMGSVLGGRAIDRLDVVQLALHPVKKKITKYSFKYINLSKLIFFYDSY